MIETKKIKCPEDCRTCEVIPANRVFCALTNIIGKLSCLTDNVKAISVMVASNTKKIKEIENKL